MNRWPQVQCDLCQGVMDLPEISIRSARIVGLLVCTQCVEDNLAATLDARSEVGLARSGSVR